MSNNIEFPPYPSKEYMELGKKGKLYTELGKAVVDENGIDASAEMLEKFKKSKKSKKEE